ELGEVGFAPPADEHVAVRQHLHRTLEVREELVRRNVRLYQGDLLRRRVDVEDECPRVVLYLWECAIVEDADVAVRKALRIVLPVEDGALAHPEIALLAAEAPDDLPCRSRRARACCGPRRGSRRSAR